MANMTDAMAALAERVAACTVCDGTGWHYVPSMNPDWGTEEYPCLACNPNGDIDEDEPGDPDLAAMMAEGLDEDDLIGGPLDSDGGWEDETHGTDAYDGPNFYFS